MEYPDYVKEGIMWLMARRDKDDRSIYGGSANQERALLRYIVELRTELKKYVAATPEAEKKGSE